MDVIGPAAEVTSDPLFAVGDTVVDVDGRTGEISYMLRSARYAVVVLSDGLIERIALQALDLV